MRLAVGISVIALAMNACGGSSSTNKVDSAFGARANAVCASAAAAHEPHPFPLKNFDPHHATTAQLAAVAAYMSRYSNLSQTTSALVKLGEPTTGVVSWDHLRELIQQAAGAGQAQITAAKAGDASRFGTLVDEAHAVQQKIDKAGPSAGFAGSSACGRYYG